MQPRTKVRCEECEGWLSMGQAERVQCDCGRQYVVTVTEIPVPSQ